MKEFVSTDQDVELWLLLAKTQHAILRARQKELTPYNITPRQAYVLSIIHDLGKNVTLREISKQVYREVHSISAQISRMEKKGILKKIRDTPGTTLTRFEITEKGLKAYDVIKDAGLLHNIMSVLSDEERQQLRLCLNKLLTKSQEIFEQL